MHATLITGNEGKLAEFKRLLRGHLTFDHLSANLPEIQSLKIEAIVEEKLRAAFQLIRRPVVVEDVSAGIDSLGGLPGPFIKFFEHKMGRDALYQLRGETAATITCTIGYYNGKTMLTATSEVHGRTVAPRGNFGFGFDHCFQPLGQDKTYAEMESDEKDRVSHRGLAVAELLRLLKQL